MMWLGISSWIEQKCKHYCSQSIYNTLYEYFGWSQFQSLPSRCFQELGQYYSQSMNGNYSNIVIGAGGILITAAGLYYARNHVQKDAINDIKIKICSSRGFHDSTIDFPLKGAAKYEFITNSVVVLDFGQKIFTLPLMFMHYIDDVESLGWSWVPPKEFIDCVNEGYREPGPLQKVTTHDIGFLVHSDRFKKNNANLNGIYDSHGTDSNMTIGKATKAEKSDQISLDNVTLKRLKKIMQLIDAKHQQILIHEIKMGVF